MEHDPDELPEHWPPEADVEYQAALAEALGEEPQAAELQRMWQLLDQRRAGLEAELNAADATVDRERVRRELARLDEQIAALKEEAGITKFVEDSVRASLEMRRLQSG